MLLLHPKGWHWMKNGVRAGASPASGDRRSPQGWSQSSRRGRRVPTILSKKSPHSTTPTRLRLRRQRRQPDKTRRVRDPVGRYSHAETWSIGELQTVEDLPFSVSEQDRDTLAFGIGIQVDFQRRRRSDFHLSSVEGILVASIVPRSLLFGHSTAQQPDRESTVHLARIDIHPVRNG